MSRLGPQGYDRSAHLEGALTFEQHERLLQDCVRPPPPHDARCSEHRVSERCRPQRRPHLVMTVATRDQHGERLLRAQLLEPKSTGPKSQVPLKTRNQRQYPTGGTCNEKGGQKRESEFRIALATSKRMLERSYRLEVSSNETNSSDDSHSRENDPDPPVPNVRCNHEHILSIRGDANIAVTIKVFLQARFEAHKKTIRQLVVVDLATNCCL